MHNVVNKSHKVSKARVCECASVRVCGCMNVDETRPLVTRPLAPRPSPLAHMSVADET